MLTVFSRFWSSHLKHCHQQLLYSLWHRNIWPVKIMICVLTMKRNSKLGRLLTISRNHILTELNSYFGRSWKFYQNYLQHYTCGRWHFPGLVSCIMQFWCWELVLKSSFYQDKNYSNKLGQNLPHTDETYLHTCQHDDTRGKGQGEGTSPTLLEIFVNWRSVYAKW